MKNGLVGIYVSPSPGVLPLPVESVRAMAFRGLEGDRYALGCGTFSANSNPRDVTLIEIEAIELFVREYGHPFDAAQSRRNLVTRGVRLNDLVEVEFVVGRVRLRGLRLCEPCAHLARLVSAPVLPGLVKRGGLYAQVLEDGVLAVGDSITLAPAGR